MLREITFNLKPEIESLEVFSPILNLKKKSKFTKSDNFILVKNKDENLIKNLKSRLENFNIIKINRGVINFPEVAFKNVNLIFKSRNGLKVKGTRVSQISLQANF